MRVAHIDTGREMRGGQWQVLYLVRGLASAGVESVVLAPPESPLYCRLREEGWPAEPLELPRLLKLRRGVDIVHAHTGRAHALASLLLEPSRLIVSRRVAFAIGRGPISRWKYRRAARFLAVSRFVANQLVRYGVPADRVRVVYDGVPLLPASLHTGPIIGLASDDPRKPSGLVRQASSMAGVPIQLTENLESALADARALVYLTWQEGLGSAVLLAMGAGVPVVASRVGGLPEIVVEGETGWLVDNDPKEVSAALRALVSDPYRARLMGDRARQYVASRFQLEHMVQATLKAYEEICGC